MSTSDSNSRGTQPSRREFLKAAVGAALVTPIFFTVGAVAEEQTPFERAQRYLDEARDLVAEARKVVGDAQQELATEAHTELTEARSALLDASAAEREQLAASIRRVQNEVDDMLADS